MPPQQATEISKFVCMALLGLMSLIFPAYADVAVHTIIGDVQFSVDGEHWTALSQNVVVRPEQSVRTGVGSEAVLQAADGSVFYLQASSQVTFRDLTLTGNVRTYQAELLHGTLNVEMPFLSAEAGDELVRILTGMAIIVANTANDRSTSFQITYDPSISLAELYDFGGHVTLQQVTDGMSRVIGLFGSSDEGKQTGLAFPINHNDALVGIDVHTELAKINVTSNLGIGRIMALFDDSIGMEVADIDEANQIPLTLLMFNERNVLSLNKDGERIFVSASPSGGVPESVPDFLRGQFQSLIGPEAEDARPRMPSPASPPIEIPESPIFPNP